MMKHSPMKIGVSG